MIYHDPSEGRANSKLPPEVLEISKPLGGLERLTSADFLITFLEEPVLPKKLSDALPSRMVLHAHAKEGILVQRKSGLDLVSSIPDLSRIQTRMQEWSQASFLLVTGDFNAATDDALVVNGVLRDKWTYSKFVAALDHWQWRGGYVSLLRRDSQITEWLKGWDKRLFGLRDAPLKFLTVRRTHQRLVPPSSKDAWMNILVALPGIGEKTALLVGKHCGDLATSIMALSDLDTSWVEKMKASDFDKTRIKNLVPSLRKYLGLRKNQILALYERSKDDTFKVRKG